MAITLEVGAADDTFRLWLVTEACRQGEVRLTAQSQNIAALETRATSIFSWSVATAVALVIAASQGRLIIPAALAGVCLMVSAIWAVRGLWPREWHPAGYPLGILQHLGYDTELEIRESVAGGYAGAISRNDERLTGFARYVAHAWVWFLAAPVAGAVGAVIVTAV